MLGKPHPFLAITLSKSNFQMGFEILGLWNFSNVNADIDYQIYNRIILSGVNRQESEQFNKNPPFFMEFDENELLIFGSFFTIGTDTQSIYALIFYVESKNNTILKTQIPFFSAYLDLLIYNVQETMKSGEHFLQITPFLTLYCTNLVKILSSGIDPPKSFNLPQDRINSFLGYCLTSHLQTQMTTIIESKNEKLAQDYFDFLSLFLTKEQMNFSSNTYSSRVSPCLFLQIVSPQQEIPLSTLALFERQWTWIKLDEEDILQGPEQSIQSLTYSDVMVKHYSTPSMENEFKPSRFNISETSCAFKLVQQLKTLNNSEKYSLCIDFFGEIIRKSILMVNLSDRMKNASGIISPESKQEILNVLEITDKADLNIIGGIASFFDPMVYRRLFYGRRDVFMQIYAAM